MDWFWREYMSGAFMAIASGFVFLLGINNEVFQYIRFKKLKSKGFMKTGFLGLSTEKARPKDDKLGVLKLYPKTFLMDLTVKRFTRIDKDEVRYIKDPYLSFELTPNMETDIFNEYSDLEKDIKFDDTYKVETSTLLNRTEAPIIFGKDPLTRESEIKLLENYFKDHTLVYINKKNEFFFIKPKEDFDLSKIPPELDNYEALSGHKHTKEDLKVSCRVWDDDTYTVYCQAEEGHLKPISVSKRFPLFYLTKNTSILFSDFKMLYDVNWTAVRFDLFSFSLMFYVFSQVFFYRTLVGKWGVSHIIKKFGVLPVAGVLGIALVALVNDMMFYKQAVARLKKLEMIDKNKPDMLHQAWGNWD